MSEVANLYDNGPISPICKIKQNLTIWTSNKWLNYRVEYIEGLPRSSQMMVDMVALSGAATIGANGTVGKSLLAILRLAESEFMHLRWEPVDDMEGILWEQSSQGRFSARAVQARVTPFTSLRDPYLATTTFWILGKDRDMNLEVRNPNPVALPLARFVFFGYRYLLEPIGEIPRGEQTTYVPAEGRA